jgi:cell division protein FtsB
MNGLRPRAVGVVAVTVVSAGLVVFGAGAVARLVEMRREMRSMERDLVALRARADDLTRHVERLRNDPAYIEKLAREELGYVRPGETILKFPSGKRAADPSLDVPPSK